MKKSFYFMAVAALALVSCSNDDVTEVNKGGAISFRTSLDKTTRANATTLSNMGNFNVTAFGNGSNYFTNLGVTSTDNGVTWNTAATYYWPNCQLVFFAYAPASLSSMADINGGIQKIANFSPEQTVAEQKDFVISRNEGTKALNESTGVPMNFKHVLSQIEVKAKCLNSKIKIEVLGVKLVNVAAKADFTFPAAETGTTYTLPQSQWDNYADLNNPLKAYMAKGTTPTVLTATAQSIMFGENNFMLIPQQLTAWAGTTATTGAYLSVLCRIYSLDGFNERLLYPEPTSSDPKTGKYGFSAVSINTNWLPGKKYIYTLTFCGDGGGGGKVDPNPTDPTDPTTPIDPLPPTGGTPILGSPIKFTVTVDDWTDDPQNVGM